MDEIVCLTDKIKHIKIGANLYTTYIESMEREIRGGGSCEKKESNQTNDFNDDITLFYNTPTSNLC